MGEQHSCLRRKKLWRTGTCSRRWQGGQRQAAEQSASAAPEEEDDGDFPRDLFVKLKKHRDSTVN
jgi:hypothetical protein